jgi:general stress protein 26
MEKPAKERGSLDELRELLKEFDNAMLVTATPEGLLRARPMALHDPDEVPGCDLWLVTSDDSPKVAEITFEENVCVACLRPRDRAYVSISARARLEQDRGEIHRLWRPAWKAWWDGPDDPSIALLKLDVRRAEYWEPEGGRLRVLYETVKGTVTGGKADEGLNPPKEI